MTMQEALEALVLMGRALRRANDFQPDPTTHTLTNDEGMELPLPVDARRIGKELLAPVDVSLPLLPALMGTCYT